MTSLPANRVEGPGNQANWDEVSQKNLLPNIGDLRLILSNALIPDGWAVADGSPVNALSNREASLVIGATLPNVAGPTGTKYIVRVK